jgi:hypothetical protein
MNLSLSGGSFIYKTSIYNSKLTFKKNRFNHESVFASVDIPKGEILTIWLGHIATQQEFDNMSDDLKRYPIQIADSTYIADRDRSIFDLSEYFNHSCDPNGGVLGHNVLVAIKNIKAGEEVAYDYATAQVFDEKFMCECGTSLCRTYIKGDDWKRKDLQKRYGIYFSSFILEKINAQKSASSSKKFINNTLSEYKNQNEQL